jgi:hypothetical protein
MSPRPPADEFHPELGYLCPSPQLRQKVRVVLAAAAFGLIAGIGGAMALLSRHSNDVAWTEPVLAVALPDSVTHSIPGPSPVPPAATPDTARRLSADGVKQPAAAATTSPLAVNEAPPMEMPARAAPVVSTVRTPATRGGGQIRAVSSRKVKPASSSVRRRAREPDPLDSFATRPLGFQLSPFAYDTRPGRRRDRGGSWPW